ncbi:MAG: hypothetical protein Q3W92_00145 [Gemmiger sp.]|nr:hypothetical protein [Gemmiger sp.]
MSIDFDKKVWGILKKLQDRGTKAKKQTINNVDTQDIKQQKAPPRNNPGGARSRVKINNEKIESG